MNSISPLLRLAAILALCALAALGILFVLDVIPREQLQDLSIKTVLIAGIAAATALVVAMLSSRKDAP